VSSCSGCKLNQIYILISDARTAVSAGFQTTLVSRDESEVSEEDRKSFNVISALSELDGVEEPSKK